jgi:predicted nucleotidyltransferase
METLFETVVGSHAWHMNHEASDIDIFRCVLADTRNVLLGKEESNSFDQTIPNLDIQTSELRTVISQLIISNFNYLVAIHTPVVLFQNEESLTRLRELSKEAISKQAYDSIHGLATQNYKKYIESKKDDSPKRCNVVARGIVFGIRLLEKQQLFFMPMVDATPEKIVSLMKDLDTAKENSSLPEKCSDRVKTKFNDYLLDMRLKALERIK